MLCEQSKMEQRYDAVMGVIREGFTITRQPCGSHMSRAPKLARYPIASITRPFCQQRLNRR